MKALLILRAAFCWVWHLASMALLALRGALAPRHCAAPPSREWDVVCVSHVEWAHAWQRNQHVMSHLAARRRVLYVFPIKGALLRHQWRNTLRPIRRDPSGVLLYHPLVIPGARVSRLVERLNARLLAACVRALVRRLGMRPGPVLWYYFPDQLGLIGRLGESAVVYDIQDEYTRFEWASPAVAQRQSVLIARADQVFTGTHALYEKHRAAARRIRFIPCGVDFPFFHAVRRRPPAQPPRGPALQPPVIGYFGLVDKRIDLAMIADLARRRPQWTFAMIGPEGEGALDGLEFPPNVVFYGHVPYAQLPDFAQAFDVCAMPFAINDLTRAINPTKTLEYFALERPVVSSPIPDVVKFYGEVVLIAEGADQWEAAIEKAIEGVPDRLARGIEIARSRSWEAMTAEFESQIDEAIAQTTR